MFLIPRTFGFHAKVSDTVMFVKRLGISKQDQANGISSFNFGPSPGVTYGGTYYARRNEFVRFLEPGGGITVLFTKWDNTAIYNAATGQFVPGTTSSDIQTALGFQLSAFGGVLQAGYGANLQIDPEAAVFQSGFELCQSRSKISGLIGHQQRGGCKIYLLPMKKIEDHDRSIARCGVRVRNRRTENDQRKYLVSLRHVVRGAESRQYATKLVQGPEP